jgi:hypothetical protein
VRDVYDPAVGAAMKRGASEQELKELDDRMEALDPYHELVKKGRVVEVPVNTKALVLGRGTDEGFTLVRILDGKHAGYEGIVSNRDIADSPTRLKPNKGAKEPKKGAKGRR